jgi:SAM-dependent methyltransferase
MAPVRPGTDAATAPVVLRTCTCCGSRRLRVERAYRCGDPRFAAALGGEPGVLRCEGCGLAQVDHTRVDAEAFAAWRREAAARPIARSRDALAWLEARGRALAELSRRHHAGPRVRSVFQFGAGPGLDLLALQRVHRGAEFWVDPLDPDAVRRSLAQVGDLAEGPFDRVLMTHVLAQVHEPVRFVRRALGALRPGGLLIIEVGNDLDPALERRDSFAPQLTFFELRTLRKLFSTHFGDDLAEVHAATAGPRVGELGTAGARPGLLARWLGIGRPVVHDLSDDPAAEDRALARIVLRRRGDEFTAGAVPG